MPTPMVTINRQPSPIDAAADAVHSGIERARDVAEQVAENVAESAQEMLEAAEFDADDLGAGVRRVASRVQRREAACEVPIEDAKDAERLRSAIIAGVVLLALSAVVFLIARRIVARREERRLERQRQQIGSTEHGATTTDTAEAAE